MHAHTVQKNKIISLKSFIMKIIQIGKSTKHIKTAFSVFLFFFFNSRDTRNIQKLLFFSRRGSQQFRISAFPHSLFHFQPLSQTRSSHTSLLTLTCSNCRIRFIRFSSALMTPSYKRDSHVSLTKLLRFRKLKISSRTKTVSGHKLQIA